MGVVLGDGADPQQPVQGPARLVAVDQALLGTCAGQFMGFMPIARSSTSVKYMLSRNLSQWPDCFQSSTS